MQNLINVFKRYYLNNWFCPGVIFLICLVTIALPFNYLGFPDGSGDMLQHFRFAIAYQDAILARDFLPSWVFDNQGLGSIGIRFYPPLAFYLVALIKIIIGNWYDAFWISLLVWMFLGSVGVYYFVKEWSSSQVALLAGIIYIILPYHLNQIYQSFLFAEFAGLGILPFCFLFLTKICLHKKWTDTVYFSISFALLITTHIPSTVIGVISFTIYVLLLIDWHQAKRIFTNLSVAVGLSLLATTYHWVKILTEAQWLAHNNERFSNGIFDFSQWMFPMTLIERDYYLFVLISWIWDSIIVLTVLLLIPAIIYLLTVRKMPERRLLLAITITALFAFFMTTKASSFIWGNLTFLQKIQFPWRWVTVLSLLSVVAFSISLSRLIELQKKLTRIYVYSAIGLVVAMLLFNWTQIINPSMPMSRIDFAKTINELSEKPSGPQWWTIWAKQDAFGNRERVSASNRSVEIETWESENREFTIDKGNPFTARIATFYYPHWKAEINGQKTEVKMDENGVILIDIPAETSKVHLYFEEPFIVNLSFWVSLFIWVFLIVAIIKTLKKNTPTDV